MIPNVNIAWGEAGDKRDVDTQRGVRYEGLRYRRMEKDRVLFCSIQRE